MSFTTRILAKNFRYSPSKLLDRRLQSTTTQTEEKIEREDEFRVLNLRKTRAHQQPRKIYKKEEPLPPRASKMATDQDWGSVWPGQRTFHPASVPLPVRQGYTPKGVAPPSKYANAELMKIPNFLHLTPPVVQRQCEALKKFCTVWPKGLETEEMQQKHFPLEVITSDYCQASPSIRNELARIVSVRIKLSTLKLDDHARDKFLRLVGERYNPENDVLTIVTDRCPLRKQNYDYAMYLLTALYHESWITEPWEAEKSEADMERYYFDRNKSKKSATKILNWGKETEGIEPSKEFAIAVENLLNEGENGYNIDKYKQEVLQLLGLSQKPVLPLQGPNNVIT
uniref:Putative 28s ribosomal protein s35 mitochondrial n=1 Tax=Tabanus bromius TaxID=304241 RepID=A0A0K8TT09_TABBR